MRAFNLYASTFVLLFAAGATRATVIGVAVDGVLTNNEITASGAVNTDGSINFYAPLSEDASGTFGVDAGTSADTCYYPSTCTGGTLDMYLRFAPLAAGPSVLTLDALDLDLIGVNDPWYFFESLSVQSGAGDELYFVNNVSDSLSNPDLSITTADANNPLLSMLIDVTSDPFFLKFSFATSFDASTSSGWYGNTRETILATIDSVAVPEPTTLLLLGTGLIATGLMRRRRRAPVA